MCILAVDIGQSKSVCCVYEAADQGREFVTVRSCPEAFRDLIVARKPSLVVIEICPAAGWIHHVDFTMISPLTSPSWAPGLAPADELPSCRR